MNDPKKDSEFDQQCAEARDKLPAFWWALYQGCLEKDFSAQQALELVKAYITSINL